MAALFQRSSQRTKMYKEGTFPNVGYRFLDREEVTGWARVHQSIYGFPGIERQLLKTEGRPSQKWLCSTLNCTGVLKLHYPEGTKTSGVVMESTACTCPVLRNPAGESGGNIAYTDAKRVRFALVRFFQWELGVPLADYRATSPRGFLGNNEGSEVKVVFENQHPAITRVEGMTGRKRRRCAPKMKFFYGKLLDDRWFKVVLQEIPGADVRHPCWTPVAIPDPNQAATRLQPLPMPSASDIVDVDGGEGKTDENEGKKPTSPSDDLVCMTCHTAAAVNKLHCPREGCQGGMLCISCTLQYACTPRPRPPSQISPLWIVVNEEKGPPCLYRCSNSCVTHMVAIGDEEKTKLPMLHPIAFLLKRPVLTFRDAADMQWAMDTFVEPIDKARRTIDGDLATEDQHLEVLKETLDACDAQDHQQSILLEIDAVKTKMSELEKKKNEYKYPNWALDWTMSEPYPKLADLEQRSSTDGSTSRGPTEKELSDYLAGFDLGVNPTRPTGHVPPVECRGPLWAFIHDLTRRDIWGPSLDLRLTVVVDLAASDSSDKGDGDVSFLPLDASDSDYEPSGNENESEEDT